MLPAQVKAVTVTWDGSSLNGLWVTNANWDTGTKPGSSDLAVFDADAASSEYTIALGGNRTVLGMQFDAATSANGFTFSTGSALIVKGSGITNNDNELQTFVADVRTSGTQTWAATSGDLTFNNIRLNSTLTLTGANAISSTGTFNNWANRKIVNNLTGGGLDDLSLNNVQLTRSTDTVANTRTLTIDGTGNTTISGVISDGSAGEGRFTKKGTGTLTLGSSANTYTGITKISGGGKVVIGNNSSFGTGQVDFGTNTLEGDGSAYTIANTSRLKGNMTLGGSSDLTFSGGMTLTSSRSLYLENTGTSTISGDIALSNAATNRTLTFRGSQDLTISGNVSNGGTSTASRLTKNDAGTVTLSGDNSYGGITDLNAGTLIITGTNTTTGNFQLDGGTVIAGNDAAFGTSLLKLKNGTLEGSGGARTFANAIQLVGGTATIGGSSAITFDGKTTLTSSRILTVTNSGATTFGAIDLSSSATNHTLTINNTGDVTINGVISDGLSTTSNLYKKGSGTLTLTGTNTYGGRTYLYDGVTVISSEANLGENPTTFTGYRLRFLGGTLQTTADMTINDVNRGINVNTGGGTLDVNTGTTLTINNVISGSAGQTLTKTGIGNLVLAGNNTLSSAIAVSAGTLTAASNKALGNTTGNTSVASGANLSFTNNITVGNESITNSGTVDNTSGTNSYSGVMSGSGNLTVTAGNLTLSGTSANTYSGLTTVNDGTLILAKTAGINAVAGNLTIGDGTGATSSAKVQLTNANQIADTSSVTLLADGQLDLNSKSETIGSLNSTFSAANILLGSATLTTGGNNGTDSYAGSISGAGTLTKTGTGTLKLSGSNTYGGTTTVNGGTLLAANNSALGANTANAVVNTGGTLALDGGVTVTKSTGALTLASAGATGSTGALHAAGTTGTTSQWSGNITLTGDSTMSAADNLLIVGEGTTFTNTIALGSNTLTLNATAAPAVTPVYLPYPSYLLDPSNIVINSTISGTGGITKTGVGTATIISPTQNTFTGDTQITGGKLIIDGTGVANNPVISSSNVVIGNSSSPGSADSVVLQMGQAASPPSPNYLIGTYDIPTNVASTSMTVYADGLFDMNGASNRLSSLTLQGGHVTGGDATVSPLLTLTSGVTTLADAQTALIEAGFIGMSANGFAFNVADGAANTDLQIDSILQNGIGFTGANNTNSMVKSGTGTLVLTSLNADGGTDDGNTYSGVTDIQAGVLNIQHNNALGQTGPSIGSLDNSTTVQTGAQLQLEGGITVGSETLTLNGTGIANTGALLNQANNNTYNGYVYLAADSRINANSGTTLTIANPGGVNAGILNGTVAGKNLTVGGSGDTTINGAIGGFVNTITKDGTGTLTLAGNNAYAGATAITSGAVKITHNNGLSGTGATVSSGAALQFAQDATNTDISVVGVASTISGTGLANGGAIQNLNGANSYAGNVTLAANARVTADSSSSLTLSGNVNAAGFALDAGGVGNTTYNGVISGAGSTVTKTDSGTVTFGGSSANTFDGGLNVNDGTLNLKKTAGINAVGTGTLTVGDNSGAALSATLALQANNQMADPTALVLNSDGRISMGTATDSISTIAGTGQIDLGSGQLTIGADNSSSSFSGSATGTGTLEKLGTGSLTLNTDINYNGTLKVGGGTLVLNNMDLSVTNLVITADTVLDFSGVSSSIFADTLSFLSTSITLNIINWNKNVDYFYATNWVGATQDLFDNLGATPMSQIVFNAPTWNSHNTGWDSYDDQIYPNVPEPSTYGLFFMAACSSFFLFRKYRTKAKQLRAPKRAGSGPWNQVLS